MDPLRGLLRILPSGDKMLLRVFIKGQETIKTIWSTQQEILLVKVDSAEVP